MSNIKERCYKPRVHVSVNLLAGVWPPSCDGVAVTVMSTRPQAIPLAMITMEKSIHGFPFLSYMSVGLRLAATRSPLSLPHYHTAAFSILQYVRSEN